MRELETRSIAITEVDAEEGTFEGVFAPYDEVITHLGKQERYERGLFDNADLVELYYNHGKQPFGGDMPIGEVTEYVRGDKALGVKGRFYTDTPRGAEAYAHTKAGRLNGLSAGFFPLQESQDGEVRVFKQARLDEVSLVKRAAYPRSEEHTSELQSH